MLISLDEYGAASKADANSMTGLISSRIHKNIVNVTPAELAQYIANGHSWCPATFKGKRSLKNFVQMQCIAIDIDNGQIWTELNAKLKYHKLRPSIVHESFSSTPKHRKWRLVFTLEQTITDVQQAYDAIRRLSQLLGGDPATAEPARLMYGCTKQQMHGAEDAYTDLQQLLVLPEPSMAKTPGKRTPVRATHIGQREIGLLKLVLADIDALIADPAGTIGSRYMALWTSARKLAQLPFVEEADIAEHLLPLVANNALWADWDKEPIAVINAGIAWGREHDRS